MGSDQERRGNIHALRQVPSEMEEGPTYQWNGHVGVGPDGRLTILDMHESRTNPNRSEKSPNTRTMQVPQEIVDTGTPRGTLQRVADQCAKLSLEMEAELDRDAQQSARTREKLEELATAGAQEHGEPESQSSTGADELIALIERDAGRHVMVYTMGAKRADSIRDILDRSGISSHILHPWEVPPDGRQERIESKAREGIDAIICNPRLVQTGISLTSFPTAVWFEDDHSPDIVAQLGGRTRRVNQGEPVIMVFMPPMGKI